MDAQPQFRGARSKENLLFDQVFTKLSNRDQVKAFVRRGDGGGNADRFYKAKLKLICPGSPQTDMIPAGVKYRDCFSPLLAPNKNINISINRNSKNEMSSRPKTRVNQSLSIHQTSSKDLGEDKKNGALSQSIRVTDFGHDKDLEFLRIQGDEFRAKIRDFKDESDWVKDVAKLRKFEGFQDDDVVETGNRMC